MALSIVPLAENSQHCSLPPMKYPKSYICKICNRQFQNGQALGGHMRCHQNALKLTNTTINIVAAASSIAAAAPVNSTITTAAVSSSPASAAASSPASAVASALASTAASDIATTFASAATSAMASVATSVATTTLASTAALAVTFAAASTVASVSATTFAAEAEIGASSSDVNAIELCRPTLPRLFKSSYLNIDLNMPAEPIDDDMDGSSLQLRYSDVKSPQHGRDRERRRKKNLGDLRTLDDEDGNTPWLQLRIGSMSDGEGEHESEGQMNLD